jgi:hypothetical protein
MSEDVIKLVTAPEREAAEERSFAEQVHEEAIGMLERALVMARERRLTGVAIAFAWEDGSYGRMMPSLMARWAALIGSVATLQHDLILKSFEGS